MWQSQCSSKKRQAGCGAVRGVADRIRRGAVVAMRTTLCSPRNRTWVVASAGRRLSLNPILCCSYCGTPPVDVQKRENDSASSILHIATLGCRTRHNSTAHGQPCEVTVPNNERHRVLCKVHWERSDLRGGGIPVDRTLRLPSKSACQTGVWDTRPSSA